MSPRGQDQPQPNGVSIQLTSGQETTIQLAKNPDGTIRVTKAAAEPRWQSGAGPRGAFYASEHMARVALRQAEERTRLLVECVTLMKTVEALDQEMLRYSDWGKYPRMEDWQLGAGYAAGGAVVKLQGEELGSAVMHLDRARSCAEFEASVWRQRAHQLAYAAGEQEQDAARRLMKFELTTAVREFTDERSALRHRLSERDAMLERVRGELTAARSNGDMLRGHLEYVQRHADEQSAMAVARQAKLQEQIAVREALEKELTAAQQQLRSYRSENEAKLRGFSAALGEAEAAARRDLERAVTEHEATRRELRQLRGEAQRAQDEIRVLQEENQRVQDDNKRAFRELVIARGDVQKSADELEASRKEAGTIGRELKDTKQALSHAYGETARSQEECEGLRRELDQSRYEVVGLRGELQKARDEAADARQELGALRGELDGVRRDLDQSRHEGAGLRGELQRAKEDGEASKKEAADVRQDNGTLRGELQMWREEAESALREAADRRCEGANLSSRLTKSQEEAAAAQRDLADSRSELARTRQRLQEDSDAVRKELAESRVENARLRGELLQAQEDGGATARELAELRTGSAQLTKERDDALKTLLETRAEKEKELDQLASALTSRDAELIAVRRDLNKATKDAQAFQGEARSLADTLARRDAELGKASQELTRGGLDCQAKAARVGQLEDEVQALSSQRDALGQQLRAAVAERDAQRSLASRQEQDILALKADWEAKEQLVRSAQRRTELLSARCENLEAALGNAHSKQADLSIELEAHRERGDKLQRSLLAGPQLAIQHDVTSRAGSPGASPRTRALDASGGGRYHWVPAGAPPQPASLPPLGRPTSARSGRGTS